MTTWLAIVKQIRTERNTTVRGRHYRKNLPDKRIYKLYEAYAEALQSLMAELLLYAVKRYTLAEYAKMHNLKLSCPPRWTDFVSEADKLVYRNRHEKLLNGRTPIKELFPEEDRLPRGTHKKERLRRLRADLRMQLLEEAHNNRLHLAAEPDSTFAQFRAHQIPYAIACLNMLDTAPMANVPKNWLELLPPEDRLSPHDDVVRTIVYKPAPVPPPPPQKPRGRPAGTKDSAPRVRRKMTDAERVKYRSKREALRSYREQCAIKYGE